MEKYYNFAGVEVSISVPEQWMYDDEKALEDFRVSQVKDPHCYEYEIVEVLDKPIGVLITKYPDYLVYKEGDSQIRYIGNVTKSWGDAYIRVCHCGKKHFVQIKAGKYIEKVSARAVLNSLNLERLLLPSEGVILHASYIEVDGKAILFTAPSGTGKSTQADLWREYRNAAIVNGDRAVIKVTDEGVYAAGIPFAGSSKYCENKILPLKAIVYLRQEPQNTIIELRGVNAFWKIWEGCTINNWDQGSVNKTADLVQKIVGKVLVYQLNCTPDERAVVVLEEVLGNMMRKGE